MIEARLTLALVVRRYNFVKVGLGVIRTDETGQPVPSSYWQYEVKSKLYNASPVMVDLFLDLLTDHPSR